MSTLYVSCNDNDHHIKLNLNGIYDMKNNFNDKYWKKRNSNIYYIDYSYSKLPNDIYYCAFIVDLFDEDKNRLKTKFNYNYEYWQSKTIIYSLDESDINKKWMYGNQFGLNSKWGDDYNDNIFLKFNEMPEIPDIISHTVINQDPYTCIKHCPGGLHRRASGKLTYPSTQTGFPFSGNWNNPGSSISGVMRCVNKIQNIRRGSIQKNFLENNVNNLGRSVGSIGGYGRGPRNTF